MLDSVAANRFRVLRKLGEGGMGEVYEAIDGERRERVAVKVLRGTSADAIVRFKREFRALQDLHHPNLVTLGELVSEGDSWCFSMELVSGSDFVTWVRTPPGVVSLAATMSSTSAKLADKLAAERAAIGFDEQKLRSGLAQLTRGVIALHDAQMVHRDIKPSNVLVTNEGRVVVLDFGLVAEEQRVSIGTTTEVAVVGTPAYMAPEQAASRPATAAADWYSVGALLYEALTGQPPFIGAPLEILLTKQRVEPPPPRSLAPKVPADLDALCSALLRFDPATRADGARILAALEGPGATQPRALQTATHFGVFVGRDAELGALVEAYGDAREGRTVTVVVHGESGIGKSWLVRHFIESRATIEPELVALSGRCFERESVPYKAFDGIIDALARFLARLPPNDARALLPARPGSLAQLFPVLRRVEAIAQAPMHRHEAISPQELRSRAFAALREVLTRLADRRPLILAIDDLQWADADSLALLAEVVRLPDAPNLLLVATQRTASRDSTEGAQRTLAFVMNLPGDVRHVNLGPLSRDHSRALARALIERTAPEIPISVDTIAGEAGGHPLFIDEIVRHVFMIGAPTTSVRLEEALRARIESLDPNARRLVELVAVAGAPMAQDAVAIALDVTPGEFARLTSFLRVAHLVKTSGSRGSDTIEPYHSRVREATLGTIDDLALRALHRKLALALESSGSADARAMATHWEGAGARGDAAKHMLRAAEQANEALAFDRAAKLYERALALSAEGQASRADREPERAIQRKLADALAMAGRGRLAARAYETAAEGASPVDALDLRRLSAEHLLRSGHLDEGLARAREVLASVGIAFPGTPLRAIVMILAYRAFLMLRGMKYRTRDASEITARDTMRVDICWSVAVALCLVDPIRGSVFMERHLMLALRLGEPYRVARAFAVRLSMHGMSGTAATKRLDAAMRQAVDMSASCGNPHAMAWAKATAGCALYIHGRFREALEVMRTAEQIFRNEVPGSIGEMFPVRLFTLQSLAMLGRIKELGEEQPVTLREAMERGDRYGAVNARIGTPNLVWLAANQPDLARAQATEALAEWSADGFHLEHYYALLAFTHVDLYEGKGRDALARMEARWSALRRSLVTRVQFVRITCWNLRGRAALAVAEEDASARAVLLRGVERDAARIESERAPWATPTAKLLRAGVSALRGDRATRAHLQEAIAGFEANEMTLHAQIARGALGARIGGHEGRELVKSAEKWMRRETIQHPARMLACFAPGLAIK